MKHAIASLFAHRTNTLVACSAAVLLAACGGTDAGSSAAAQTAAKLAVANADKGAVLVDAAATAAAAAPLSAASFNVDGYEKEVQAASAVSAAPAQIQADSAAAGAAQADGGTKLLATLTSATPNATTSTYHLYVATTGSDSNTGTQAAPFKTINKAASVAKAGTTVHVAAGTYNGNVSTKTSGTATARISFVSDTKWGAKIVGTGSEAMWTNNGNYVDISGFDIRGPGRLGILNYASNTLVANNHIHNLTLSGGCTGDGGAGVVNATYGSTNGDMIGNVVHDIGTPGSCNGVQGLYSSNTGGKIMNNVVYRVSSFGIHLWHAASGTTIANNTVFANGSAGMGGGIVIGVGDSPGGVLLNNVKVLNNIVYNNPRGGIQQYCYSGATCIGTGNVVSNNLVYGSKTNVGMLKGSATGTISADPKFVSYNPTGTGDYRLQSGSPAVNKGIASGAPATDILGVARPKGGAFDIGAYESF
ncbi:right-handed parallel beta-helix repeat-containing protein [Massilia phyllosphaerae]|uniref:right-handed parallel beta-helix repeat-containing protein n=1 Tax=Massilia phyllosphaerae TaxID=3106034 RepID=UPI002B1CB0D4|nr:right-handed parallel beta-helix repeat-containing protein [Massilia sp. SGZ-792]